jgi:ribosomal protein L21
VKEGDVIHLDSLSAQAGEKVVLGEVLLVGGDGGR